MPFLLPHHHSSITGQHAPASGPDPRTQQLRQRLLPAAASIVSCPSCHLLFLLSIHVAFIYSLGFIKKNPGSLLNRSSPQTSSVPIHLASLWDVGRADYHRLPESAALSGVKSFGCFKYIIPASAHGPTVKDCRSARCAQHKLWPLFLSLMGSALCQQRQINVRWSGK